LATRRLNPRAARGWREVSLELKGLGSHTELEFALHCTDRDGKDVPQPASLLLAVAEPTIHDLDAYGQAKGVVLISIDTLRRDHVGLYGYKKPTTPRLDALGAQGLVLEDAVSTASWTLPAHLSMLTSVDPGVHGGVSMKSAFNRKVPTLAQLLKQAGFSTHAVTSHLYVSSVYGLDQGFDGLDFHQDRKAADTVARGIDLIDRFGDRPFFVFLHFYDPHWHYDPPAETLALFERGYSGGLSGNLKDFQSRTRASLKPGDLEHLLALYDGEIRYTDDQVGVFLDHLQRRGLDKGTLVFVTSDHGEEFLEHESWEHQKTLYEEVVRIPMLVRGPGVTVRREAQQASVLDVSPTVLTWAGVAVPGGMQGRSLLAKVDEREAYGETDHTLDHSHKLFLRAGEGRWKAIFTLAPDTGRVLREEWYDLASDPGEARSVQPRAEIADKVRERAIARWRDARGRGGRPPDAKLTDQQAEELHALGYVSQ
jgi:arylsulfatase A-like enzyme